MAVATNRKEPWNYVLKGDLQKPVSEQTIFVCHPMDYGLENIVSDKSVMKQNVDESIEVHTKVGENSDVILAQCLKGWSNFKDAEGKDIPFVEGEFQQHLRLGDRIEISEQIRKHFDINENTAKNSQSGDVSEPDTSKD